MNVYRLNNIYDLPILETNTCVIGALDGIHLGHKDLILQAKNKAEKVLVITFENLPKENYYLSNSVQKAQILEEMNVDYMIVFKYQTIEKVFFNEFIKILKKLKVKNIVCGIDFRFGYKREGDVCDLKKHFKVFVNDYTTYNNLKISTSTIKEFLIDGYIEEANKLLDRPYSIIGKVFEGNKVGRTLGFPTANIDYTSYLLPKNGAYFVKVKVDKKEYIGMANIGFNPTINLQNKRRFEVHILDFNEDIYGKEIEVEFIKFIRDEEKYSSKEELINSLNKTVDICRKLSH